MKNKKILLFIFVMTIVSFVCCVSVSAKTCTYKQSNTGREIQLIIWGEKIRVIENGEEKGYEVTFSIKDTDKCPSKIYTALASDIIYKEKGSLASTTPELDLVNETSDTSSDDSNNSSGTKKVNCGNVTNIPAKLPELTSFAITVIQIVVPIILVIMGTLDLFKGVTAQKEDEIKKGQQMLIKRIIVAAIIFFVVIIVRLVISLVADSTTTGNIVDCVDCFISNKCEEV